MRRFAPEHELPRLGPHEPRVTFAGAPRESVEGQLDERRPMIRHLRGAGRHGFEVVQTATFARVGLQAKDEPVQPERS